MASDTPAGPSDQSKKLNYTTSSGQPSTNNTKQVQVLSAGHKKLKKEDRSHSNMGSFESDIKRKILGRTKAEKAFRPWWDFVEDWLMNSLVFLDNSFMGLTQF